LHYIFFYISCKKNSSSKVEKRNKLLFDGMLIFGIVLKIDAFSMGYYSVLGLIGWLGWHLVSIIFGVGILRAI